MAGSFLSDASPSYLLLASAAVLARDVGQSDHRIYMRVGMRLAEKSARVGTLMSTATTMPRAALAEVRSKYVQSTRGNARLEANPRQTAYPRTVSPIRQSTHSSWCAKWCE